MVFSSPKRRECETVVQNGLSITPSDMARLTSQGVPISANNLGVTYQEGVKSSDFTVPAEYVRGVDMADLWNQKMDSRVNARKVYNQVISEPKGGE